VASAAHRRAGAQCRRPSIVLLDLRLYGGGSDLLAGAAAAGRLFPSSITSASDRSADRIPSIDLSAMGFVPKRAATRLMEALSVVMSGSIYVPPVRWAKAAGAPRERMPPIPPAAAALLARSPRSG
jgi:DNA-binding NarL/FixJ family response regulator